MNIYTHTRQIPSHIPHESIMSSALENNYSIHRPIQYLGSKVRSLEFIKKQITDKLSTGNRVLDMFSGTSVVAQSLASVGYQVVACDVMKYSYVFSSALLNIGRDKSALSHHKIISLIESDCSSSRMADEFSEWLAKEDDALSNKDASLLIAISNELPQAWRPEKSGRLKHTFQNLQQIAGEECFEYESLMSSYYAGTYLGIRQAITIDQYRCSIERLFKKNILSHWEYSSCLTALLTAMSKSAFTPGKHFAQYHKLDHTKNLTFHKKRILTDRAVDISYEFGEALKNIFERALPYTHQHKSLHTSLEELLNDPSEIEDIGLIYADPPYTAQQYSRFYHIPETLVNYKVPDLQKVGDKFTVGLYPENRFKSRFSSKKQAPSAFEDLANLALSTGASLALSYSDSASGSTGNSRMISLEQLTKLLNKKFKTVEVSELPHTYRQFNSKSSAIAKRADRELFIFCS